MFRLSYKPGGKLEFKSFSVAVYYIADDKNIKNNLSAFEKKFRTKLSQLQHKEYSCQKEQADNYIKC